MGEAKQLMTALLNEWGINQRKKASILLCLQVMKDNGYVDEEEQAEMLEAIDEWLATIGSPFTRKKNVTV